MSHNRTLLSTTPNALFSQKENAAITYEVNWSGRLGADTIATSTWTAENSGSTLANEANTDSTASVRLSGTPGRYLFTNKITLTTSGDTLEQQLTLQVTDNNRGTMNDYCGCFGYNWRW